MFVFCMDPDNKQLPFLSTALNYTRAKIKKRTVIAKIEIRFVIIKIHENSHHIGTSITALK